MTALFEGSSLLLQGDLLHCDADDALVDIPSAEVILDHLASSIRQAFAFHDDEGALLVIELDNPADPSDERADQRRRQLERARDLARTVIRKSDILEILGDHSLVVALPGSGRIGMTRVADAIRQKVWADHGDSDSPSTTITVGAVHTTESSLVDLDELLLAAQVNLDSARAAGGNRTNWSDWTSYP